MKIKLCITKYGHIFQTIHRELIIEGSGSGKTNALLSLIENQPDIDKYICTQKIHMNANINT